MTSGFVVHAGGGQAAPGAGRSVLAASGATGGSFSLLLSHAPAGDGVPLHVHHGESESFFVLAGTYRIRCGDDILEAGVHDFVYLPQGVPHAWQDGGDNTGRKLILAVPGGIENFFDDLATGVPLEELTHRHGVQFLE